MKLSQEKAEALKKEIRSFIEDQGGATETFEVIKTLEKEAKRSSTKYRLLVDFISGGDDVEEKRHWVSQTTHAIKRQLKNKENAKLADQARQQAVAPPGNLFNFTAPVNIFDNRNNPTTNSNNPTTNSNNPTTNSNNSNSNNENSNNPTNNNNYYGSVYGDGTGAGNRGASRARAPSPNHDHQHGHATTAQVDHSAATLPSKTVARPSGETQQERDDAAFAAKLQEEEEVRAGTTAASEWQVLRPKIDMPKSVARAGDTNMPETMAAKPAAESSLASSLSSGVASYVSSDLSSTLADQKLPAKPSMPTAMSSMTTTAKKLAIKTDGLPVPGEIRPGQETTPASTVSNVSRDQDMADRVVAFNLRQHYEGLIGQDGVHLQGPSHDGEVLDGETARTMLAQEWGQTESDLVSGLTLNCPVTEEGIKLIAPVLTQKKNGLRYFEFSRVFDNLTEDQALTVAKTLFGALRGAPKLSVILVKENAFPLSVAEVLESFIRSLPAGTLEVVSFNIGGLETIPGVLEAVAENASNLKAFVLGNCDTAVDTTPEVFRSIACILCSALGLEVFQLCGLCGGTKKSWESGVTEPMLFQAIGDCQIKVLEFSDANLGPREVSQTIAVISRATKLERLSLQGTDLSGSEVEQLFSVLAASKCQLVEANFKGSQLGPAGGKAFGKFAATQYGMKKVSIAVADIDRAGIEAVIEGLLVNHKAMVFFSIAGNDIVARDDAVKLGQCLAVFTARVRVGILSIQGNSVELMGEDIVRQIEQNCNKLDVVTPTSTTGRIFFQGTSSPYSRNEDSQDTGVINAVPAAPQPSHFALQHAQPSIESASVSEQAPKPPVPAESANGSPTASGVLSFLAKVLQVCKDHPYRNGLSDPETECARVVAVAMVLLEHIFAEPDDQGDGMKKEYLQLAFLKNVWKQVKRDDVKRKRVCAFIGVPGEKCTLTAVLDHVESAWLRDTEENCRSTVSIIMGFLCVGMDNNGRETMFAKQGEALPKAIDKAHAVKILTRLGHQEKTIKKVKLPQMHTAIYEAIMEKIREKNTDLKW